MEPHELRNMLEEKGVKPSLHRMKILEYLVENKNHPTVDNIFKEISGEIPTLSKTTIYNTLTTFVENGIAQAITIEDNEVKYDATVDEHAHFKCTKCGNIYDINMDTKISSIKTLSGHLVHERQLYFKGICRLCQKKK
jgi:Fur family peroxide stress response transcriptional regulator